MEQQDLAVAFKCSLPLWLSFPKRERSVAKPNCWRWGYTSTSVFLRNSTVVFTNNLSGWVHVNILYRTKSKPSWMVMQAVRKDCHVEFLVNNCFLVVMKQREFCYTWRSIITAVGNREWGWLYGTSSPEKQNKNKTDCWCWKQVTMWTWSSWLEEGVAPG